jgi:hypothetical protein
MQDGRKGLAPLEGTTVSFTPVEEVTGQVMITSSGDDAPRASAASNCSTTSPISAGPASPAPPRSSSA